MHACVASNMRQELAKIASRKTDLFSALLKKLPKDVVVLEIGKSFKLDVGSPFYSPGADLKSALRFHGAPGKLIAKSIREDKRYIVVPPADSDYAVNAMGLNIKAPSYEYLAHEAGHAVEHDDGPVNSWLHSRGPGLLAGLSPAVGLLGGGYAAQVPKSLGKGALLGALVGGGIAGLGQIPLLYREGKATERAMRLLGDVGATEKELTHAKGTLGSARKTYNRLGAGHMLLGSAGALGAMMRVPPLP